MTSWCAEIYKLSMFWLSTLVCLVFMVSSFRKTPLHCTHLIYMSLRYSRSYLWAWTDWISMYCFLVTLMAVYVWYGTTWDYFQATNVILISLFFSSFYADKLLTRATCNIRCSIYSINKTNPSIFNPESYFCEEN